MTIQEIEQKLNECQKALVELKESKKEKWKPQAGDSYCYRDYTEKIVTTTYMCFVDECRAKNMPIFKTKEECKRYWHFMDTVKEKSYEFSKEEWASCAIDKYYIYRDFRNNSLHIAYDCNCGDLNGIYFKDRESAQYIIDNFKEELMEYWL